MVNCIGRKRRKKHDVVEIVDQQRLHYGIYIMLIVQELSLGAILRTRTFFASSHRSGVGVLSVHVLLGILEMSHCLTRRKDSKTHTYTRNKRIDYIS